MNRTPATTRRRASGFTLLEVLMAMAIFVIGFTMVMTLFPAALLLQKRTVDDVQSKHAERNAEALLQARPIVEANLVVAMVGYPDLVLPAGPDWQTDQQVYPLPAAMLGVWPRQDRSYPVDITVPEARRFYWVPLVQDRDPAAITTNWAVFVFVLRRGEGLTYPKPGAPLDWANQSDPDAIPGVLRVNVTGITNDTFVFDNSANLVRVGDPILDSNGVIYAVTAADPVSATVNSLILANPAAPTDIWIGNPSVDAGPSPAHRLVFVQNAVQ